MRCVNLWSSDSPSPKSTLESEPFSMSAKLIAWDLASANQVAQIAMQSAMIMHERDTTVTVVFIDEKI